LTSLAAARRLQGQSTGDIMCYIGLPLVLTATGPCHICFLFIKVKVKKAVPMHAMEALGGEEI
jgi:hypothetical protein